MRPMRRIVNPDQKKVLVLMSNTGGGHRASAEAIEAGFKQLYGDKCASLVANCKKSSMFA